MPFQKGNKINLRRKKTEAERIAMSLRAKLRVGPLSPGWKGGVKKDKEHNRLLHKEYVKNNRARVKEITKIWQKNNPEKYKDSKRRDRIKNKERINHANRMYYLRKSGAVGSFTLGEWETLKKQYGFICLICGKSEPVIKLTKDHIIPLSKGGSNFIENIQPLCLSCNCRKKDTVDVSS
jgi:5-methylcytosine-specific restriction endonuclease McrA